MERISASLHQGGAAIISFRPAMDVPHGGVLLALPALARVKSIESLRYCPPGEWGKLLGLDRIPEVRTLREKLAQIITENKVTEWISQLCSHWLADQKDLLASGDSETL